MNILGVMMVQQRSEQSLRDADHTAREAEQWRSLCIARR